MEVNKRHVCFVFVLYFLSWTTAWSQNKYRPEEANKHMGDTVTICGKVFSGKYLESTATKPTLLNMGGHYPNHLLTIVIKCVNRKNFTMMPEKFYVDKNVCVTGRISDYKGWPEIFVEDPKDLIVEGSETRKEPALPGFEKKIEKPRTKDTTTTTANTFNSYTIEISGDVNMRAGPDKESALVTVVKAESEVTIYKGANGWSYVSVKKFSPEKQSEVVLYGFIKNNVLK